MGLPLSDEHRALADAARSLLADLGALADARSVLEGAAGRFPAYWPDAAALGWHGIHVSEAYGGLGYGLAELLILAEELGRVVAPGPFLSTVVAAGVLDVVGTEADRVRWLPSWVDGTMAVGIGLEEGLSVDGRQVSGVAGAVVGAVEANLLLMTAGDDAVLVEVGEGVTVEPSTALDPTLGAAVVRCAAAPVLAQMAGGARHLSRLARTVGAAYATGGMRACTEMAVDYAKSREQFGRPIGSFQAVKHQCTDMLVASEMAVAATWDAGRPTDSVEEADLVASVAAATALPAYLWVAQRNVQIHGGIGYTWEHDAHLHLRRAVALLALCGGGESGIRRVADLRSAGVRRRAAIDLPAEADRWRAAARDFAGQYRSTEEGERRRLLARSGYMVPHWPAPYGRGAGAVEQLVLEEELRDVDRPSLGLGEWVLPTLVQYGTLDQQERWLWPALEGDSKWCQLFSEPGAGSDAAAISTRAVRVEGGWSVTGQKVWTSDAQNCDWGLATVRTDPSAPKHAGVTMMGINIQAAGVEVRPLREMTGETLFNEVFFDDVFVPDDDVVGEVDGGWVVARATFGTERVQIGGNSSSVTASDLVAFASGADPALLRDLGALLAEEQALAMLNLRQAARAVHTVEPGVEGSLSKLAGAEHAQRVADLGMRLLGTGAVLGEDPRVARDFLYTRCLTIAGGTSEVLRSQIAERILGLPREPTSKTGDKR